MFLSMILQMRNTIVDIFVLNKVVKKKVQKNIINLS